MEKLINKYTNIDIQYSFKHNPKTDQKIDNIVITTNFNNITKLYKNITKVISEIIKTCYNTEIHSKIKIILKKIKSKLAFKKFLYSFNHFLDNLNPLSQELLRKTKLIIIFRNNIRLYKSAEVEYLQIKNNLAKNIDYFISDYSLLNKKQAIEKFTNCIEFLAANKNKQINKQLKLKLPCLDIATALNDAEFNLANTISKLKILDIECICFNFIYKHASFDFNTHEQEYPVYENLITEFINAIFQGSKRQSFIIISFIISNIDECFDLDKIMSHIGNNYSSLRRRYIINFKIAISYKHSDNIMLLGRNIFVNRTFCNVYAYSKVFTLFRIIKLKFIKLNKNYIKMLLAKYLVGFKYFDFDRLNDNGTNRSEGLQFPSELDAFNSVENNEVSKLLLLSNTYLPIK
jgi:hypothetical protein